VIIDVAIDQGGCIETSRPTTHSAPTYIVDDVVHYCVTNMPGAVGRTSTFALCNVTLPYVISIAKNGVEEAAKKHHPIARAINIYKGEVTNLPVAETFNLPFSDRFVA
jgi:alanine dehydrogenase